MGVLMGITTGVSFGLLLSGVSVLAPCLLMVCVLVWAAHKDGVL